MQKLAWLLFLLFSSAGLFGQILHPTNGVPHRKQTLYALERVVLHPSPGKTIKNATVLVRDGKIVAAGSNLNIPKEAVVISLPGKHIYPGFIELQSQYGLDETPKGKRRDWNPQLERSEPGPYSWNQAIRSEIDAIEQFKVKSSEAAGLRKFGLSVAAVLQADGIARGSGAIVSLGEKPENESIIISKAFSGFSFQKGSSTQDYPSSFAGSVALLRQTFLDAQWYAAQGGKNYYNRSLEALNEQKKLPAVFETRNWMDVLKAAELGKEAGMNFIITGNGDEYQALEALKKIGNTLVVPVNFPEAIEISDVYAAESIPLSYLLHWEAAPANPALLHKAGIPFALSTKGCESPEAFFSNLRRAILAGLPASKALEALTITPAKILGVESQLGKVEVGYRASFFVSTDTLFAPRNQILEHWVDGVRYAEDAAYFAEVSGVFLGMDGSDSLRISLKSRFQGGDVELRTAGKVQKAQSSWSANRLTLKWNDGNEARILSLNLDTLSRPPRLSGTLRDAAGNTRSLTLIRVEDLATKTDKPELPAFVHADSLKLRYPHVGFGYTNPPIAETVLLENASVWTNEKEGVLQNASVLISNGKILGIGQSADLLKLAGKNTVRKIDASGKHITPGIIDEHSHIALSRGVNEGTQNNTAEVRMGDAVNSTDIDIYRQLAGGVTTSQLLHGSANPIGGQSALIKLRWGKTPQEMLLENAAGHIKFALGENVKQSNWGDRNTVRFPQTRMGVEQVYYDAFQRAKEYQQAWEKWNAMAPSEKAKNIAPYKDLELEAMVEIIRGTRHITCHSYVQSEINMLMHVADSMGFKVNTFTHILEGYKLADKMKKHGANASSFSDWWAYKWEVNDAIPYNGSILNTMGITTGFNSDDAEMARRLNQEAGKAVLYGQTPEEEALKFVTLNPAKMLKIDNRTGSLKAGKDADLVVWSHPPLSVKARAEYTFVDGICYFDRSLDAALQQQNDADRARIIAKMSREKASGKALKRLRAREKHYYTCEDLYHEEERHVVE